MATKVFSFPYDASADVYVRIFGRTGSDVGKVYDADDDTFKSLGTATTPYIACTEQTSEDGTGLSVYTVSVDLADLNSTLAEKDFVIKAYDNSSPADTDAAISEELQFTVQASRYGVQDITATMDGCNTSSTGTAVRYLIRLYVNGEFYQLANSATCVLTVREQGSGTDKFTSSDDGTLNPVTDAGYFEYTKTTPGFTDDRLYEHEAVITESGVSITRYSDWQVFG